jgi:hypothetical protein
MTATIDRLSMALAWLVVTPVLVAARLCEPRVTWFANVTDET